MAKRRKRCKHPEHNELLHPDSFPEGSNICSDCIKRDKRRETNHNSRERAREFIIKYLLEHPCEECGEKRLATLSFNHRIPAKKKYNIADMVSKGYGIESIKKEVRKCEVLCLNCHSVLTAKQFSFYTYEYSI